AGAAPLTAVAAPLPDPASIPPRAWLYGTRLIRRFVSVLVAPGGVGKSALALAQAAAVATGRPILGEHVHHAVPVWVLNLEDPAEETHRRLAALMRHHAIGRDALEGRLYLHSGRDRRVTMGELADGFGSPVTHPDRDAVVAAARERGIGLIVVDPFVKSHRLDENSNAQIDAAATAWAEVSELTGAAVLLVHHVRKGAPADIEAARGAKALTDAARAAAILAPMSEDEAAQMGVAPGERWRHIRLDDAKANLAPRATAALWYRLETVALGNGTADYPSGDNVAVVAPWRRPVAAAPSGDVDSLRQALAAIGRGPGGDLAYSAKRGGRVGDRWAGHVLMRICGMTDRAARLQIETWLADGILTEWPYRDRLHRKRRIGLRVTGELSPQTDSEDQ
ncbi:MAG TPA: AAA family ATPase, partial [Acetobacteraceae bacterium]|nr:AAA family ATPase [Acetobacteraceae bacterium]